VFNNDMKEIMKNYSFVVFAILIISTPGLPQDLANIPGMFLDIGYGARPMGMGGAFTATSNDVNAMMWNPAGLAALHGQYATFFYTRQFNLIPYTLAAYANDIDSKNMTHSEAIIVSGDDALRETILLIAGAYKLDDYLPNLQIGATLKYKNANFGDNPDGGQGRVRGDALGLGLDLGAIYPIQEKLCVGIVLKNLFDTVSWNTSAMGNYTQDSPMRMVLGMAILPDPNFTIGIDVEKSLHSDTMDRLSIGVERRFFNLVSLRSGAFQDLTAGAGMNYNFGIGFQHLAFNNMTFFVDAAYVIQEIENSLRFSLTMGF